MDALTLVAHCIWATVVSGAVGAIVYFVRADAFKSKWALRVAELEGRASATSQILQATLKEVAMIREGLEKLRAIPPKQPRL